MLFSRVKISCFRAKAHLVFHRCLYNKHLYSPGISFFASLHLKLRAPSSPLTRPNLNQFQASNKQTNKGCLSNLYYSKCRGQILALSFNKQYRRWHMSSCGVQLQLFIVKMLLVNRTAVIGHPYCYIGQIGPSPKWRQQI